MSFWFSPIRDDAPASWASGQSTLTEIWDAAREQMRLVDNTTAKAEAYTRAYDERIRAIRDATGETFENPMNVSVARDEPEQRFDPQRGIISDTERTATKMQEAVDRFNVWLADVEKRHPDRSSIIRAGVPVERDAEALAKNADERLAKSMAANDGVSRWMAAIGGGVVGSAYDPIQVMTMFAGGGPGGARTIGGRILSTALKEAAVNGFVEAALQPQVQSWRKEIGIENGLNEALKNVAFAATIGGVLGGGVQAGGEAISRMLRPREVEQVADAVVASPATRPEIREAFSGEPVRASEIAAPIRNAMPAEARGAIDAISSLRAIDDMRPAAATIETHDAAVSQAMRAAQTNTPFSFEPDPEQVRRIVDQLVPDSVTSKAAGTDTLAQFLMRTGGVQDFRGELRALGLENVSERFVGRLVRENGLPLDEARRAAAEAGYFDHRYGTPDEAMEKSTIRDLLDELDAGSRETSRSIDDGGRAYADGLVNELVARAGPAVDDKLILKAAELSNAENIAPAEALDRVLIDADRAAEEATRIPVAPERIDVNDMRGGLDDPGRPIEDTFFTEEDLADLPDDFDIPFFDDGRAVTPEGIKEELERLDWLSTVVEACRA